MRAAAILAGGRATRFGGRDKSALVVDGRTILDRQIATLQSVEALSEILIIGRATHPLARTIADVVPDCGPLGGIHAALTETCADQVLVLACDTPHVTAALVTYLFERSDDADIVVPCTKHGYHPLCAVYSRDCLEPIAQRLAGGRLKVADLFDDVRTRVVRAGELERFGDPHRLLTNVNTPADYAALNGAALESPALDDAGLDFANLEALHDHKR